MNCQLDEKKINALKSEPVNLNTFKYRPAKINKIS
jgi:hypothetical protein